LKQLLYQLDTVPENVEQAYQQFETRGSMATPDIDSFADLFIACSKKFFSKVLIFVDAFDESLDEPEEKRKLITMFHKILKAGPKFYTYITTRPHLVGELSKDLEEVKTLEIKAVDSDISKFLDKKLEVKADLDSDIQTNIKTSILSKAQGM